MKSIFNLEQFTTHDLLLGRNYFLWTFLWKSNQLHVCGIEYSFRGIRPRDEA